MVCEPVKQKTDAQTTAQGGQKRKEPSKQLTIAFFGARKLVKTSDGSVALSGAAPLPLNAALT